jgi:hypothetical protein
LRSKSAASGPGDVSMTGRTWAEARPYGHLRCPVGEPRAAGELIPLTGSYLAAGDRDYGWSFIALGA